MIDATWISNEIQGGAIYLLVLTFVGTALGLATAVALAFRNGI
jgi:hypothetical protein